VLGIVAGAVGFRAQANVSQERAGGRACYSVHGTLLYILLNTKA